jgi:Type I restriction modification DNA specificity domain
MFRLSDLFDFKKGKVSVITKSGKYPIISASTKNNGKAGLSDNWTNENCITIANDGAPGAAFWHPYKFSANAAACTGTLKFKTPDDTTMTILCAYISTYLMPRYSYSYKAGIERLNKQLIPLPIKDNSIDFKGMHDSYKAIIKENINKVLEKIDKI